MSNGAECCAVGICCPPASPSQRTALIQIAMRAPGCTDTLAAAVIDALSPHVAFAPKSIEPFLADIVAKAKAAHP